MYKVPKKDYQEIVEMYNRDGRDATYEYIKEHYGMKYPARLITKLKREPGFTYDYKEKKFAVIESEDTDKLFMSLDELCSPMVMTHVSDAPSEAANEPNEAMEKLIRSLISDRLLELSKYISLNTITKTIMVDRSSMTVDGYNVLIH